VREYKFRGKRVDNGEWVYGNYFIDERDIEDGFIWRDIPQIQQRYGDHFQYFDIDPSTVGQYTGLKDKNGREIYEGDIIRSNCGRSFEVYWSKKDSAFYWKHFVIDKKKRFNKNSVVAGSYEVEVIGSIFDKDNILKED